MKTIFKNKNKKGISEIISFVLLVVLAIGLATGTYFFLKEYSQNPFPEEACPEGLSVTITNYSCEYGEINLTIKNNGRFNFAGFLINGINNTQNFEYPLYVPDLGDLNNGLNVTNSKDLRLNYVGKLSKVIIYPYIIDKQGYNRLCEESVIKINVNSIDSNVCSEGCLNPPCKSTY